MNHRQASQCEGKAIFPSWARAEAFARKRKALQSADLAPYVCSLCHKIHLGTRVQRSKKLNLHRKRVLQQAREE